LGSAPTAAIARSYSAGPAVGGQVDRIAERRALRQKRAQRAHRGVGGLRQDQALRFARVGEQDSRAAGVGYHADARTGRNRLCREHRNHVEQFHQRVGADHSGLLEQRLDRDVQIGQRGAMAGGGTPAGRRSPRFDRHDRAAARDLGRQARELARIADTLEIEHDHAGARVVEIVCEEVVIGDIRAIAGRNEGRNSQSAAVHVVEDRDTQRAALRVHPDIAGRRQGRREGAVQPHRRVGIQHAHAIRSYHPHPRRAHRVEQPLLLRASRRRDLGEARRDHHHAMHAGAGAVFNRAVDQFGGHGDQR
jgi:hypothetical protein